MATFFKNKLESEVGTTESEIISTLANARVTVIGLSLTNLTEDLVLASIRLELVDGESVVSTAHYIKDVVVPPNQSLRVINGGEKLVLAGNMKMYISASVDDSLDVVASYVEIL
jgi:hypothetical protein